MLKAFLSLLYVDVVMLLCGYKALHRRLARCRAKPSHHPSLALDMSREVHAAIDRAAIYYPRACRCLHRSVAATWLLRRRGVPATMVVGCRHTPFYAHAWVEIAGAATDQDTTARDLYQEMYRI